MNDSGNIRLALEEEEANAQNAYKKNKSEEDKENIKNVELCCLCEQSFPIKNEYFYPYFMEQVEQSKIKNATDWVRNKKVRDHCHITGK